MKRLELRETSADDAAMKIFATLPNLTYLELTECRLPSADGLAALGGAKSLETLSLSETKTNDATIQAFGGLKNLKMLDLSSTSITDESAATLGGLPILQTLKVNGTQLSDDAFLEIAKAPKLTRLEVKNTSVGYDLADRVKETRDDLEIVEY